MFGLENVGDDTPGVGHGRSTESTGEETEDNDRGEVLAGTYETVEKGESDVGVDEEGSTAVDLGHGSPDKRSKDESEDETGGDYRQARETVSAWLLLRNSTSLQRLTHDVALDALAREIDTHIKDGSAQHRTGHADSQRRHGGQDDDGPLVSPSVCHGVLNVDKLVLVPLNRGGDPVNEVGLLLGARAIVRLLDDPGVRGSLSDPGSRFEGMVLVRSSFGVVVVVILSDRDGRRRRLRFLLVYLRRHWS